MADADVAAAIIAAGASLFALYLFAIPFGCCCHRNSRRPLLFVAAWVLGTAASALLWDRLGRHAPPDSGSWSPWTAAWCGRGASLMVPATEAELREAVRRGVRPLRAVGGGHSWSMTSLTPGTFIDMRKMNSVVRFNASSGTVTVQAGMRVQQAVQFLLSRGLCLYGVGSIREQAIGGVISHGVHGPHPDGFNRHVVGLRVLLANGTLRDVQAEEDLRMWRSSMGMLGVIVEATLQAFPLMRLRFESVPIQGFHFFDEPNLRGIMRSLTFTGFIYTTACSPNVGHARVGHPVAEGGGGGELNNQSSYLSRLNLHFNDHMHPAMQYIFWPLGAAVSCLEQLLAYHDSSIMLSGPAEDILPNDGLIPRYFEIIDYEYMLPLRAARTFAQELLAGRFGLVLIPICVRLVRAEPSCLTMAAEDSCAFGVELMRGDADRLDVAAIERRVGELGGMAHFGKVTVSSFRHYAYPCLPKFRAYRQALDPENAFLTPTSMDILRMSATTDGDGGSPADAARARAIARAETYRMAMFTLVVATTAACVMARFALPLGNSSPAAGKARDEWHGLTLGYFAYP